MDIYHEAPFHLMEKMREYTDGEYALVHLFENYPDYFDFFVESLKMGRKVILDNSVFELEKAFDADRFVYWIDRLQPTEYIIPDVLDDSFKTIESCMNWVTEYSHYPGKTIGVIQGATVDEAIECYSTISLLVDKVAISFNCAFYKDLFPHENILFSWMNGRQMFIDLLLEHKILDKNQPFHLLGCSLPQEFKHYKQDKYKFIESVDTSNPIVHAINNIVYEDYGLNRKISIKMINYLHHTNINHEILDYDIKLFREFAT